MLSAVCPRNDPMFSRRSVNTSNETRWKMRGLQVDMSSPKAEVRGSNPLGCASLFNHLE